MEKQCDEAFRSVDLPGALRKGTPSVGRPEMHLHTPHNPTVVSASNAPRFHSPWVWW